MTAPHPHWRTQVPPWSTIWHQVAQRARDTGLVHGQYAVDLVLQAAQGRCAAHPSDAADLLRDMVDSGALVPAKLDLAGASYSVRTLRCLDGAYRRHGGASNDGSSWVPTDAHLWTYTAPQDTQEAT